MNAHRANKWTETDLNKMNTGSYTLEEIMEMAENKEYDQDFGKHATSDLVDVLSQGQPTKQREPIPGVDVPQRASERGKSTEEAKSTEEKKEQTQNALIQIFQPHNAVDSFWKSVALHRGNLEKVVSDMMHYVSDKEFEAIVASNEADSLYYRLQSINQFLEILTDLFDNRIPDMPKFGPLEEFVKDQGIDDLQNLFAKGHIAKTFHLKKLTAQLDTLEPLLSKNFVQTNFPDLAAETKTAIRTFEAEMLR